MREPKPFGLNEMREMFLSFFETQLLCIFSQEKVSIRVAFDPDMELIGLSAGLQKSSWSLSNLVNNFTGLFRGD